MSRERWAVIVIVLTLGLGAVVYFTDGGADLVAVLRPCEASLEEFVDANQIGSSRDVWLMKSTAGITQRVGLFFGYEDDYSACTEAAGLLSKRYPGESYTCIAARQ